VDIGGVVLTRQYFGFISPCFGGTGTGHMAHADMHITWHMTHGTWHMAQSTCTYTLHMAHSKCRYAHGNTNTCMLSKEHMYMKMYTKVHIVNISAHVSKSA